MEYLHMMKGSDYPFQLIKSCRQYQLYNGRTISGVHPLGLESYEISSFQLSSSSSHDIDRVGPNHARLRHNTGEGAWCPARQLTSFKNRHREKWMISRSDFEEYVRVNAYEWIEVDLLKVTIVTGIATQGRFGNGNGNEWTDNYIIQYSLEENKLSELYTYSNSTTDSLKYFTIFHGNSETDEIRRNFFIPPVIARRIRIVPILLPYQRSRSICLRFELYGCSYNDRISHYRITDGISDIIGGREMPLNLFDSFIPNRLYSSINSLSSSSSSSSSSGDGTTSLIGSLRSNNDGTIEWNILSEKKSNLNFFIWYMNPRLSIATKDDERTLDIIGKIINSLQSNTGQSSGSDLDMIKYIQNVTVYVECEKISTERNISKKLGKRFFSYRRQMMNDEERRAAKKMTNIYLTIPASHIMINGKRVFSPSSYVVYEAIDSLSNLCYDRPRFSTVIHRRRRGNNLRHQWIRFRLTSSIFNEYRSSLTTYNDNPLLLNMHYEINHQLTLNNDESIVPSIIPYKMKENKLTATTNRKGKRLIEHQNSLLRLKISEMEIDWNSIDYNTLTQHIRHRQQMKNSMETEKGSSDSYKVYLTNDKNDFHEMHHQNFSSNLRSPFGHSVSSSASSMQTASIISTTLTREQIRLSILIAIILLFLLILLLVLICIMRRRRQKKQFEYDMKNEQKKNQEQFSINKNDFYTAMPSDCQLKKNVDQWMNNVQPSSFNKSLDLSQDDFAINSNQFALGRQSHPRAAKRKKFWKHSSGDVLVAQTASLADQKDLLMEEIKAIKGDNQRLSKIIHSNNERITNFERLLKTVLGQMNELRQ
ncbi:hypothetical protein SNEBB_005197, partial [Seison nebaliae]